MTSNYWYDAVDEAEDMINLDVETDIGVFDIDADVIRKASNGGECRSRS